MCDIKTAQPSTNVSEQGGVLLPIWSIEQISTAMHITKQAYQQVAD
jgi:hypothetical protein